MSQAWTDYRLFWREFRRAFHTTGAVLPSGRALAESLTYFVRNGEDRRDARRILEVGPGTGAVTRQILRALRPRDELVLIERNERFVARLRELLRVEPGFRQAADRITVHCAAIEDMTEDRAYDVIVSGLPLNNFSQELVAQILSKFRRLLAPSGTLSFFEYIGVRRAKALVSGQSQRARLRGIGAILDELFRAAEIRRDRVLVNVPPAWVHHVRWSESRVESQESRARDLH